MSASRAASARPTLPELDELTLERVKRGERRAPFRRLATARAPFRSLAVARAQHALVTRYEAPVFALLSRMLPGRPRALVEDLAQDTFLKVFSSIPRFRTDGSARLSSWILTIASRVAIDHLRKEKVRARLHLVKDEGQEQPDVVGAREIRERVTAALDALNPEQRATFVLRQFHDLSLDEIARAEGTNVGTVKSRLSRAKAQLRAALSEFVETPS